MKIISTSKAREYMSEIVNKVAYENKVFAIGRRNKIEALIIKYPDYARPDVSDITNLNSYSESFDFLKDEPDLYSRDDLKKKYA